MDLVRRISALTLVVTLSLIGIPLPVHAADEESPPLTINGRPLSEFLNSAAAGAAVPLAGLVEQEIGQITGVALDEDGHPLAEYAAQLTRVFTVGGNRAEQISGRGMTNAEGAFSFTGLPASNYVVEVLSGDEVVASASATLADGAMEVTGITLTGLANEAAADRGMSRGAKIGTGVAIGVGLLVVAFALTCAGQNQGGPCGY